MSELYRTAFSTLAIVAHGGGLMRMISVWKGIPPSRQLECLPPRGSLTVYDWQEGVATYVE